MSNIRARGTSHPGLAESPPRASGGPDGQYGGSFRVSPAPMRKRPAQLASAGTQFARVVRNIAPLRRASAEMSFRIGPRRRAGGFGERAISTVSVAPSCTPPTILRARSRRRRRDASSSPQPFLEQIVSPMISSSTTVRLPETVAPMEHTYKHARVESSSLLVGSGPDATDLGGLFRIRNPRSEGSGCRFGTR